MTKNLTVRSLVWLAFAVPLAVILYDGCSHKPTYDRAKEIAIRHYGDRVPPLTESETNEWYAAMGVRTGEQPTIAQLRTFNAKNRNHYLYYKP